MKLKFTRLAQACLLMAAAGGAIASSHREAPFITTSPKVDGTDFYMFRSYEGIAANGTGGRSDYVTLLANYQPLQAPYGGPNYFQMDPNALYEIHIDNNGDAKEDITFQFRFKNNLKSIPLQIGTASVPIPLISSIVWKNCASVQRRLSRRKSDVFEPAPRPEASWNTYANVTAAPAPRTP